MGVRRGGAGVRLAGYFHSYRHGATITLYVTGMNLQAAIAPPSAVMQPDGMQVVLRSFGYPVRMARPYSPGMVEWTVQLPADLPAGEIPIWVIHGGALSTQPVVLPVGTANRGGYRSRPIFSSGQ